MKRISVGAATAALTIALFALGLRATPAQAQQILLDKIVKAGELNVFPDLGDPNKYYYFTDKVRLATDENGNPKFSFLRYVQNVRTGADQAEAKEGEGGGIVQAWVTLGVTPEQRAEAERDLQRTHPGAHLEGPILCKAGRFALTSVFADGKGKNSTQVLGLGNAPLLDGEMASVAIELTKDGAKKLWESFKMASPGISFRFEMDLSGYRSPKRVVIDADWDKVYDHKAFNAAVATTMLAAEVNAAYDELRKNNSIHITQIGTDEKMEELIASAYKTLQERMFEPTNSGGTPGLESLNMPGQGQASLLDRATNRLKEAQVATDAENARIRGENKEITARNDKAQLEQGKAAGSSFAGQLAEQAATDAEAEAVIAKRRAKVAAEQLTAAKAVPDSGDALAKAVKTDTEELKKQAVALQKEADDAQLRATKLRADANKTRVDAATATATASSTQGLKEEKKAPTLSIMATLQIKHERQTGHFHLDLNKYMPENMTLPFEQGIGGLSDLMGNPLYFRSMNMDDPLFKQRELVAMVDVQSAQDFGQYVNFVDVEMRKKHANGEVTNDEVRVDRNNFNKEGNNFKLLYGWNGDNDRTHWMDYEVQSTWSFAGGKTIVQPWAKRTQGTIGLAPPLRRRSVLIDGDVEKLQQAEVRAVTVKVYYDLAGSEQSKQVTLNIAKGQIAEKLEMLTSPTQSQYAFEIMWQLKGNRTVSSPRQTTISDNLYVDELPTTSAAGSR